MTNFEYYKDKLINMDLANIAVDKETNELCQCFDCKCDNCLFDEVHYCGKATVEWLYEEHKE